MMTPNDSQIECEVAGIVKKITLKNFMCHEHFQVQLNPHINFICGKNGSGKSAILTALVIVLGGKSSDTNRGSRVKDLIRSGKNQAIIEITLSNRGPNAYKPDLFGDELTITRVINVNSSLYKLSRSDGGKRVSCKRGELTDILNMFKIQIENPISVLNQDMAKSFIKTSNPKDLYKFFIKSTFLNKIEDTMTETREVIIPQLDKSLSEKINELNDANKNLDDIKKKHEKKKLMVELQKESESLQTELNWALVYSARSEQEKMNDRLIKIEKDIELMNRKILDRDGLKKELDNKKQELTSELNEFMRKKDEHMAKLLEFERDYNKLMTKYKDLSNERKSVEKKLHASNAQFEQTKHRLNTLDSQNKEAAAKRNETEAKREALRTRIEQLKTLVNTNNNHKRNLTVSLKMKNEQLSSAQSALHQILANINKTRMRLKELKSHSSELTCYGDFMPRLVEEIERANQKGRFECKPVGPLGHFIKLNGAATCGNGSFGPAIEATIGRGLLCGFAVNSFNDFNVLKQIFSSLRIINTPDVIISKFSDEVHDVRKFKVRHPTFCSMFDALDFSHPVVANTVIDQVSVENILLLPTNRDAYNLMDSVHKVPPNCACSVTPDSQFYPAPNYRSYHLTKETTTKFLQVNKESLVRDMEVSLKSLEQDEAVQRSSVESIRSEEKNIQKSLSQLERDIQRIDREVTTSDMELLNLDSEEGHITFEQEALKEDLAYRKKTIDELTSSLKKIASSLESAKHECEKAKEAKRNSSDNGSCDSEINRIQESLNEVEVQYRECTVNFTKFKSKLKDHLTMKEKVAGSSVKLKQDLINLEKKAQAGRIVDQTSCRDEDQLKERLSEVRNEIEVINDFIGHSTLEEITEDLQMKFKRAEDIKKIIQETRSEINDMCLKTEDLKFKFEHQLKDRSKTIRGNFKNITNLRNYEEDLIFDHTNRKLNIIVKTEAKHQNSTSVLCLSGGERSYSMVAFILSLWQEMELPFYFLDEFDVFMDPVNRNLIIKLLMMHARGNRNKQFVFFTPNNFNVDTSDSVGIFRMKDPRDDRNCEL